MDGLGTFPSRARLVLGWGTAWEDLRVLSAFSTLVVLWMDWACFEARRETGPGAACDVGLDLALRAGMRTLCGCVGGGHSVYVSEEASEVWHFAVGVVCPPSTHIVLAKGRQSQLWEAR